MKKVLFFLILTSCFSVGIASANVTINGDNGRLAYSHWLPRKVYIAFNQQDGVISSYRVAFQADDGKLFNEWKLQDDNGNQITFPFVLESTLIIDDKNEVKRTENWGFGRLDGNNSNIPNAYLDSTFCDLWGDNYGIGILNPYQLQNNAIYDYWIELEPGSITPKDCRTLDVKLRFRLNIDLSVAKKFGYTKDEIDNDLILGRLWKDGYNISDNSQNYFPQEIGDQFSFAIEERKGSDKLTYSDYFVLSGMEGQWCKERDGAAYQVNSIEECFNFGNSNNNPAISTIGNHTHIIHPDYRCSKELPNGKILCWENGGDTNCWDAYKWYEFNGNIDEVSNHHNDSNWTTTRERSMCSEVYNSGDGNSSGGNSGGNSGPGYGDDSGIPNPWAGYDHDVGLKYVKIGKKSSGHWHGSVVWTENEIPNHRDFRIKVKRKGGQWKDTCAELWFSHNKYFTDDDLYLATKCKDLSDSEYDNKDEKSIYIKNVSLPAMEVGKNYYFFTVLKYDGGQNPSTRTDHDEYVKVEIISEPSGSGKSNNGSGDARWNSLPEATKAAIMSIIFD